MEIVFVKNGLITIFILLYGLYAIISNLLKIENV